MKPGWQKRLLGDIASIAYGFTASANSLPVGPRFLRITDIQDNRVAWEQVPYCEMEVSESKRHRLENGDIVFARTGATTGKSYLIRDVPDAVCASYLIRVRANQAVVAPSFLSAFFQTAHYWEKIALGTEGAAQGGFNASKLAALSIPLPPLGEQRRIVAILDEAFVGLDRARANAEANLASARELLANTIDAKMISSKAAAHRALGEICDFENGDRGKNYPGRKAFVPTGVPFINAGHLLNGPIDWEGMNFIPAAHFQRLSNGKVRRGDVLFCLRGSLGKFGIVDTDEPGAIASSLIITRPREMLSPEYLAAYFASRKCSEMIQFYGNGAAQPNLSAKSLSAFEIALPDLAEQTAIVDSLAAIRNEVASFESMAGLKLRDVDGLRQSLLQKAFAGELT